MREKFLMCLTYTAYIIRELWVFIAYRHQKINPYSFSDQTIAYQTWICGGLNYGFSVIIAGIICLKNSNKLYFFWNAVLIIAGMEFIEYWLNYNDPWSHVMIFGLNVAINVTNFRYAALGAILIYELWKK